MRIGGLATGMDIDQLVNRLMAAERMPLDRMKQDQQTLTWQRDAFRDVNKKLSELDNMFLNMKLSQTYSPKTISSSQESAITATGATSAANGTYNMNVTQMTTSAINVGEAIAIDPNVSLREQGIEMSSVDFTTYDKNGEAVNHSVRINENDTSKTVLQRITNQQGNNVRAFYDESSQKVILETTRTGSYNLEGSEITFNANSFFASHLGLSANNEKGGQNAQFEYNNSGIIMESKSNNYQLNGITFNFKNVTEGNAALTVNNDVEASFDKIMAFIDKYNEVVDMIQGTQQEERYRDYKPLTDEQKKDMSEKEIELWEERAKSGLLRGESTLTSGLFSMRQGWYSSVNTGGSFTTLTQLGIVTSSNYLDGGKLVVKDGSKLREALQEDPSAEQKLFSNNASGNERGLVNRLEDSVESIMGNIATRAGKDANSTLENYTLGNRLKEVNTRISDFERRLVQVESRYWNQFTAMEKAISRMNMQSQQLMSQFGGM